MKYPELLKNQCDLTDIYKNQLRLMTHELKKARNTIHNLRAFLVSFISDFQIKSPELHQFLDLINQDCDDKRLADIEDAFKTSLMSLFTKRPSNSSISILPSDLIYLVLGYLSVRELTVFSYTCKEFFLMCQSQKLWNRLGQCRWGHSVIDKSSFMKRYSQEMMWFHTRPAVSTLVGHSGSVTCLSFIKGSSHFISASDDCSLCLWEVRQSQENAMIKQHHIQTKSIAKKVCFYGHGGPVWTCCQGVNNSLISGSHDKTIKIWNMSTGQCQATMRGHTAWISSLDASSSSIASAGWDGSLKIWSQSTRLPVHSLVLPDMVYSLKLHGNSMVLGFKSKLLEIWDLGEMTKVVDCSGHNKAVNAVKVDGNLLISASSDCLVKVWDVRTGESVINLAGHNNSVNCIDFEAESQKIVSGGYDKTIRVWDMRNCLSARCVLRGHSDPVFCLGFDEGKLVSGSMDHSIKIWNFVGYV